MRLSRRFTLMMAIIALILYSTQTARSDEPLAIQVQVPDEPMLIIPATKLPLAGPAAGAAPIIFENGLPMPGVDSAEYRRIYESIPFSRAEYRVNPTYRHDSAMEILTGHARHQTIVQHNYEHKQPVQQIPAPARPSRFVTPFSGFGNLWGAPIWNYRSRYW